MNEQDRPMDQPTDKPIFRVASVQLNTSLRQLISVNLPTVYVHQQRARLILFLDNYTNSRQLKIFLDFSLYLRTRSVVSFEVDFDNSMDSCEGSG